jgi:putative FmdB family regulatory protein
MPLYEYQCRACGAVSEHLVGVGSDQPDVKCECGSTELERTISLISVNRGAAPDACCGGGECGGHDEPCCTGGTCACGG